MAGAEKDQASWTGFLGTQHAPGKEKPVQEGSIGLVVFGAGHVNRAEPPELFKGGAFEKLAKRPESPVSAKAPALNARGDLSSPHGRR